MNMLKVKEIEMSDVFSLTEMKFENTSGNTFCKDYENGFALVLNPCEKDGKGKVKINFFMDELEIQDNYGEIDKTLDISEVYDDISELIRRGIVIYE